MAVHVVPARKSVTVKMAGVASEADAEAGETVPLEQVSATVMDAVLSGTKFVFTLKTAVITLVLVMVQLLVCPVVMPTPAHAFWLAT